PVRHGFEDGRGRAQSRVRRSGETAVLARGRAPAVPRHRAHSLGRRRLRVRPRELRRAALIAAASPMHDMLVRLYDLPALEPALAEIAQRGVLVRRALSTERVAVLDWVRARFA